MPYVFFFFPLFVVGGKAHRELRIGVLGLEHLFRTYSQDVPFLEGTHNFVFLIL